MESLTLYELNQLVREVVETSFDRPYWIRAELSDVKDRGHCYLEFVEKDPNGNEPIAKARGQIWSRTWHSLRSRFISATGEDLKNGMQVLALVEVTFHEKYGFSLNVVDIDPTYTLGAIARRRQEIIAALKAKGIFFDNKNLPLPRLLNRIAVISSSGAAGYQDFCNQLTHNPYGLRFHTELFESLMQGNGVEQSIMHSLDRINERLSEWDAVVIIRGGGSSSDLSGFDSLALGEYVAQFPLPVITGIGHERDTSVIDEVAHTRVKTPTAAAEFLITHQYNELQQLTELETAIRQLTTELLDDAKDRLNRVTDRLPTLFQLRKERESHSLDRRLNAIVSAFQTFKVGAMARVQLLDERIAHQVSALLTRHKNHLEVVESKVESSSPERLLRLGYSISRVNGKAVTDVRLLHAGDRVITTVANGSFASTVNERPVEDAPSRPLDASPDAILHDVYLA